MTEQNSMRLTLVRGVAGESIYLNDVRIAGPKPWAGGQTVAEWTVRRDDVECAIRDQGTGKARESE